MKTSKRYLVGTMIAALALPAVLIASGRLFGPGGTAPYVPARTSPAELAALRDFTAIEARGDFALEAVQGETYSVSYEPLAEENKGELDARVANGLLVLTGFGNRTLDADAVVRITMPALRELSAQSSPNVVVSGFGSGTLTASLSGVSVATFTGNTVDALTIQATAMRELNLDAVSAQRSTLTISSGNLTVNHIP